MINPNDAIRNQILRYFFDRNLGATSRFGKKGSAVKISDVKRELKTEHGLTQAQVMSNLTYLIDRGWVKTVEIEKTVKVKGGTIPSTVTWYEIAAPGIEKIEGDSEFRPTDRYPGINITATGSNIITLGDGNVVNASYKDLHKTLTDLKQAIALTTALPEVQKLELSADIESIKDQLAKTSPDRTILSRLWSGIEKLAVIGELVDLVQKASILIGPLMG